MKMRLRRPARLLLLVAFGAGIALLLGYRHPPSVAAADALASTQLKIGGATIDVSFAPGALDLPQSAILGWISRAAEAVSGYYGRFPLHSFRIRVFPEEGRKGVFHGTTYGYRGGYTRISVGQHTTQGQLDSDWMITHEMIHLAFPDVGDRQHWIEEGLATYVEPIARAQAGQVTAGKVWGDLVRDLPQGEPEPNDRGLDNTHTWGRTYWGGALFSLVADVRIRECSQNRKGLQDALRAILDAGGTIEAEWPLTRAFQTGDAATGCTVLMDLYNQMKDAPVQVDLPAMWRQLGVESAGGRISFNDGAALAGVRRAILALPR
jgi:hypothetical protein